jgi:hypothetical protein
VSTRLSVCLQSYVADDGCLHIVAERSSIREAVSSLDLGRAALLTRLSLFWVRRVRWVRAPPDRRTDSARLEPPRLGDLHCLCLLAARVGKRTRPAPLACRLVQRDVDNLKTGQPDERPSCKGRRS